MGKGGVEPPPLLGLPPQRPVGAQQLSAHGLKGRADLAQLILGDMGDGEIQIIGLNAGRPLRQNGDGLFQLPAVEEGRRRAQAQNGEEHGPRHLHNIQQEQQPALLGGGGGQGGGSVGADQEAAGGILGGDGLADSPQQEGQEQGEEQTAEGQQEEGLFQPHVFQPFHL